MIGPNLLPWNRRYALKSYISGSMWLVPLIALLVYALFHRLVHTVDAWLVAQGWTDNVNSFLGLSAAGARSQLETFITMNLSFIVFTFGSLLVAIQVAGGQYTPRIIATTLLRDNSIRWIVGVFLLTLAFAVSVLTHLDETVSQLDVFVAGLLGVLSVMAFLYLIDYAARLLRPVSIVQRVGEIGIGVIQGGLPGAERGSRVRPSTRSGLPAPGPRRGPRRHVGRGPGSPPWRAGRAGPHGRPPHRVRAERRRLPRRRRSAVPAARRRRRHRRSAAARLGRARQQRTMEQDPTFALRILVDIAIKALSRRRSTTRRPPSWRSTSCIACCVWSGCATCAEEERRDAAGHLRLVYLTPNWRSYVHLTCTEIRHCGAGSIQIVRRMRSLLENLLQSLPAHRHAELHRQLELLDRAIDRHYPFEEDRALAPIANSRDWAGLSTRPRAPRCRCMTRQTSVTAPDATSYIVPTILSFPSASRSARTWLR